MRLRSVDLNLLLVFEAVDRERSITKAADLLNLSQPAVSHALGRLRILLKDQLFVRSSSGMEPTPRARDMAGPVRQAVVQLQGVLDPESFDPASARQTFTIAVNNFAAIVLAAPLAALCAARAPNVRLVMRPSGTLDLDALLHRGVLDLAIGDVAGDDLTNAKRLIMDRYVAVMRRGHPKAKGRLSASAFAGSAHLAISSIGEDMSFIDREMARRRLSRSIALEAPYLAAGAVLAGSDMIGVVARQIALDLCTVRDVTWKELPFDVPPIWIGMKWPRIYDGKASHKWLRSIVEALTQPSAGGGT